MYSREPQVSNLDFNQDEDAIILTIPDNLIGYRLDIALAMIIPELSRNRLTNWIKNGLVLVDNHNAKPKDKVKAGSSIVITPSLDDALLSMTPENIPLNIIYEDEHILVINKQAGLVVHPGNGNLSGTLLNALLFYNPQLAQLPRAGIVHRLDKDTTGLMVVAKTIVAQTNLVRQLHDRQVKRIYQAIVIGQFTQSKGIIDANIGRDPRNRIKMAIRDSGSGKTAITHYEVLKYFAPACLSHIQCRLETGRTHQIRVHCESIGHPLIGDKTYNKTQQKLSYNAEISRVITQLNRQALHATELSLMHPETHELMHFNSVLAPDIQNVLNILHEIT